MKNIFEILKQTTDFEALPTKVLGATVAEDIIITRKAVDWLINAQADAELPTPIRLYMQSTADKSKQYCMMFDDKTTEFDNVYQIGKINIVIDRKNLFYFMGIIIDYVENSNEEGFVFLDTDDQKVGDYYTMLADEQAMADYYENVGNNDIKQSMEIEPQTQNTLYQDQLYDIKEDTEEDCAITENVLEATVKPEEQPVLQNIEPAEDATVPVNSEEQQTSNLTNSPKAIAQPADNNEEQQTSDLELPQSEQSLPVPHGKERAIMPADKTSVVQKRTITGIHFQD